MTLKRLILQSNKSTDANPILGGNFSWVGCVVNPKIGEKKVNHCICKRCEKSLVEAWGWYCFNMDLMLCDKCKSDTNLHRTIFSNSIHKDFRVFFTLKPIESGLNIIYIERKVLTKNNQWVWEDSIKDNEIQELPNIEGSLIPGEKKVRIEKRILKNPLYENYET